MKEIYSDELDSRRRRGWAIIIGTECVTPPTAYKWPRRALRSSSQDGRGSDGGTRVRPESSEDRTLQRNAAKSGGKP